VVQSLVGKVSGLQINKSSNGVNGTSRIVLRGSRSITGNNEALVVIDNAISSSTVLQQLPPELIASVNVIKGCKAQLFMENKV
jgi:outer membrane cobalamin receptor